jgi:transposase
LELSDLAQWAEETAMSDRKDIILVADYHAQNIEYRCFNEASGEEHNGRFGTSAPAIVQRIEEATRMLSAGGKVVWIMESTTGWARVKDLIGVRAEFVLANVLEMPLPPKARRRKTDKIDTGRLLREYLNGRLPTSFQPEACLRQARRLVDFRQELVVRKTAVRNWIGSLLHHETWHVRTNLWSEKGLERLRKMDLPDSDRELVKLKLEQLEQLSQQQESVEARMQELYDRWPEAQWLDEIRGIGMVTAVSMLAHIGPIQRFATAEDLIGYAGLAPGVRQSDGTSHHCRIGGGGTDGRLRWMLIEATQWLCQIPRYRPTYERVMAKRGKKVARIVVARMVLRSIHKMLLDRVRFNPVSQAPAEKAFNALEPAGGLEPVGKRQEQRRPKPKPGLCAV